MDKRGEFTVKSSYKFLKKIRNSGREVSVAWGLIWKLSAPAKVKKSIIESFI